MKKKVFFVLSSFKAGGAERVFWLLSQNFDKKLFDVTIVLLSAADTFFTNNLDDIKVIDLKTVKASRSFSKLYNLLKSEKPDAVFTTGGQVNLLMAIISLLLKKPVFIARPTNQDNRQYLSLKGKVLGFIFNGLYKRFDKVICQSEEIKAHVLSNQNITEEKLVLIPNPVNFTDIKREKSENTEIKRLVVVARLTAQKGIERLLDVMCQLPPNYHLIIVGEGQLKNVISQKIIDNQLTDRVKLLGVINNVLEVVSKQDLFVLPSFIEGFPNVVIESLSVGTPVVSFEVGGISEIIDNDFNGFIVKQNDLTEFKRKIMTACEKTWDHELIKVNVYNKFSIEKVTRLYERLIS